MKRFFLLTALLLSVVFSHAQEQDPWAEYMMPGELHKQLELYTGDFSLTITMWMEAGGEPLKVIVSSVNAMTLGGRFLEMKQSGDLMGTPYEATTTIGYNNSSKKMELTTMTNMGTGILYLTGDWDASQNTADLSGQIINPMTKKTMTIRQVVRFEDSNLILIQNYDGVGKKAQKSIEYLFTRKE